MIVLYPRKLKHLLTLPIKLSRNYHRGTAPRRRVCNMGWTLFYWFRSTGVMSCKLSQSTLVCRFQFHIGFKKRRLSRRSTCFYGCLWIQKEKGTLFRGPSARTDWLSRLIAWGLSTRWTTLSWHRGVCCWLCIQSREVRGRMVPKFQLYCRLN